MTAVLCHFMAMFAFKCHPKATQGKSKEHSRAILFNLYGLTVANNSHSLASMAVLLPFLVLKTNTRLA
jgi:hypothetical protein